ncbi:MAG: sulfotransferase family 2 domain-containing protein [Anaeromicrobium sp.]|jgi:hypothetical protein|uniref:sulfotransferase family 2 domain-containing protein n=1 Tax=Anaeromicrobium sp. TaxID=1929132 RepID=UPI0025EDAB9C|nr:sulfotransferase family 2 domain-containing protein [Anaeromicrobium sp.]MCT4595272.1 sulfotransferase family 2 domain-containing protein [Anaeromicrobium sp.]
MQKTLLFLHIPKTAGGTLHGILKKRFKEDERMAIASYPNISKCKGILKLEKLSYDERKKLNYIFGHYAFGIHELLPKEFTYITFLRNPVERIISLYYYLKNPARLKKKKYTIKEIENIMERMKTLEKFIEEGPKNKLSNGMTRLLCGNEKIQRDSSVNKQDLEKAKKHLMEYFCFFGITEEFDKGLSILENIFGWEPIEYKNKHVVKHPSVAEIPEEIIRKIEEMNELDIELYQFAKEKYIHFKNKYGIL